MPVQQDAVSSLDHAMARRPVELVVVPCRAGSLFDVQKAAPTNRSMAPSTISARPGQLAASVKPALGSFGSKVLSATVAACDRLPLSRPCQMDGPASSTKPTATSSAPNPKNSMLVSPDRCSRWRLGRVVAEKPPAGEYHLWIMAGLSLVCELMVMAVVVSSLVVPWQQGQRLAPDRVTSMAIARTLGTGTRPRLPRRCFPVTSRSWS